METNLYTDAAGRSGDGLLPTYFKRVGVGVLTLTLVVAVVLKIINPAVGPGQNGIYPTLVLNALNIGLILIAWARDRVEGDRNTVLRLKSLGFAFVWAVFGLLIEKSVLLLSGDPGAGVSAPGLIMGMLVFYLIFYHIQKRGFSGKQVETGRGKTHLTSK